MVTWDIQLYLTPVSVNQTVFSNGGGGGGDGYCIIVNRLHRSYIGGDPDGDLI